MQDRFNILAETLKAKCRQTPVYYIANSGNWGDAVIRYGTLKFFNDINLEFKEIKSKNIREWLYPLLRGGTVIYGGGGAWCKLWGRSAEHVNTLKRRFNVIVLPSTYELNYPIPKTTFFTRDIFESKQNMPASIFCHDMAFYIGEEFFKKGVGSRKGYFFRTDRESANRIEIPAENNDISPKGNHFSNSLTFFEEVNRFSTIYTDRLHIAIAAVLLRKPVHFYHGAYFKNKAVYMSSMKDYFDNIYFHEDFDF